MTRSALAFLAFLLAGVTVGLATVGVVALTRSPAPYREERTCEPIEMQVRLHSVDLVFVPGQDEPIPMTGTMNTYTRMLCNGVEVLIRSDATHGLE